MIDPQVSGYAAAIFEVARAEGHLPEVSDQLFRVARAVEGSSELLGTLSDPRVPIERKRGLVADLLTDKASRLTTSLVQFVVEAGRVKQLGEIADGLAAKAAAETEHEVAEVRSAIPLDANTVTRLEQALSKATGKRIEVRAVVDETVVGGVVTRVGDLVIDGSVRHRLQQLREAMETQEA